MDLDNIKGRTNYSKDAFIAFFMLYASHVDINFSEKEKEMIMDHVTLDQFNEIYDEFMDLSDFQALQTIMSYRDQYFKTPEMKAELLGEIKALFYADGDFSVMERELLHFLEKLMG